MLEFVRFKERLTQSHARAVAYVESAMLLLTSGSPAPAAAAAQVAGILPRLARLHAFTALQRTYTSVMKLCTMLAYA